MRKLFICLLVILLAGVYLGAGCEADKEAAEQAVDKVTGAEAVEVKKEASQDIAVARCQELFYQKTALGENLDNGPCLEEKIVDDWACDVAHDPRAAIDDKLENQCSSYRSGDVSHFVELDTNGELIRAQ